VDQCVAARLELAAHLDEAASGEVVGSIFPIALVRSYSYGNAGGAEGPAIGHFEIPTLLGLVYDRVVDGRPLE
jgi:hypothetical protein